MSGHPGARPPTAAPAAVGLLAVMDVLAPLAQRFVEGGHELSLVGGPVRDLEHVADYARPFEDSLV